MVLRWACSAACWPLKVGCCHWCQPAQRQPGHAGGGQQCRARQGQAPFGPAALRPGRGTRRGFGARSRGSVWSRRTRSGQIGIDGLRRCIGLFGREIGAAGRVRAVRRCHRAGVSRRAGRDRSWHAARPGAARRRARESPARPAAWTARAHSFPAPDRPRHPGRAPCSNPSQQNDAARRAKQAGVHALWKLNANYSQDCKQPMHAEMPSRSAPIASQSFRMRPACR